MANHGNRKLVYCFLAQVVVLGGVFYALGWFQPVRVGDTADYELFPFHSVVEGLRYRRTFGYPLFLKLCGLLAPNHQAVPVVGFALHVLAVCLFWWAVRRIIRSDWTCMLVASSLLYSHLFLRYGNNLAADSLASSLAIASIGLLLTTVLNRSRLLWFCLLATTVFATYQVRPAYLFLVPLLPLLGPLLLWLVAPMTIDRRQWRFVLMGLLATALLPYLAFCAVRWLTVDRFSLVSFGGSNFSAVTCMFLAPSDVAALPPDVQQLAEEVMRQRAAMASSIPGYVDGATQRYMEIEGPFDVNLCQVTLPAAVETHGDDGDQVDRALWRLALAIVAEKPEYYGVWIVKAFVRGVYMIVSEYIMNPVYFLLAAALAVAHAISVVLRKQLGTDASEADPSLLIELNTLWLISMSFALASLLLVIVTTPPLGRFMDASGVFLACVLTRGLTNRVQMCRYLIRLRSGLQQTSQEEHDAPG